MMKCPECDTPIIPYGEGYGFCPRCDVDYKDERIKSDDPVDETMLK